MSGDSDSKRSDPPRSVAVEKVEAGRDGFVVGEVREMVIERPQPAEDGTGRAAKDIASGFASGVGIYAAIRCEQCLIRWHTRKDLSEESLADEARENDWYQDDLGPRHADVGKLLELHHVPIRRYTEASPWDLSTELRNGHQVILVPETHEGWDRDPILADIHHRFSPGIAEPIVVTGVDSGSYGTGEKVIVVAPGTSKAVARYPTAQFSNAWKESKFFMVATQEPPLLDLDLLEMEYLNHEAGLLGDLGGGVWAEFQTAAGARAGEVLSHLDWHYHEAVSGPIEADFHELDPPMAYDFEDRFDADQEDDLVDTEGGDWGDSGGFDVG